MLSRNSKQNLINRVADLADQLDRRTTLGAILWEMAEAARITVLGELDDYLNGQDKLTWWERTQVRRIMDVLSSYDNKIKRVDNDEKELFDHVDFPEIRPSYKSSDTQSLELWTRPKLKDLISRTKGIIKLRSKRTQLCDHMITDLQIECRELGIYIHYFELAVQVMNARALKEAVEQTLTLEGYQ